MKRSKLFLISQIKEIAYFDNKVLKVVGSDYEVPFITSPTKGNHSYKSCSGCRTERQNLVTIFTEKFNKFPNCCRDHKKLNQAKFFNKDDFGNFPKYTTDKIMYCYHHILNNIDEDDWYNDIIDYLEYTVESFGSLPNGYGYPYQIENFFHLLKELLENVEDHLQSDRVSMIEIKTRINKVSKLLEPITNNLINDKADIDLLINTYENWYKIFPFDLPYFSSLKDKYSKILPLFTGKKRYNKYLKLYKNEVHTKESLTIVLFQITKDIIRNINGLTLYKKGELKDTKRIEIDLILENRRLELLELSEISIDKELDYIELLKTWFEQEKKFINEIKDHLEELPSEESKQFSVLEWATIFYYANTTKLLPSNKTLAGKMKSFQKKHGFTTTINNIKKNYYQAKKRINEENNYPIHKLEKIIPFLLKEYTETVTKVENDINILDEYISEYQ